MDLRPAVFVEENMDGIDSAGLSLLCSARPRDAATRDVEYGAIVPCNGDPEVSWADPFRDQRSRSTGVRRQAHPISRQSRTIRVLEIHQPLGVRGERYRRYRPCDMFALFHLQWLASRAHMRSWQTIVNSQQYKSAAALFGMTSAEATKLQCRSTVLNAQFDGRRSIIVCLLAPEGVRINEHLKAAVDLSLGAEALFLNGT